MAFVIDKAELAKGKKEILAQHSFIANSRKAYYNHEAAIATAGGFEVNAMRLPGEVWRDFDIETKRLMTGDEGGVLLNDLAPLTRSVHIGKIVTEYRQYGDDQLEVRSSIDGQHAKPVNRVTYQYDGSLVLVHSTQVGRTWRELEGMRSEGYDGLMDDQAAAVRFVQRRMSDDIANGTAGEVFKGYASFGIKSHPNTIALDLGAAGLNVDLTDSTLTLAAAWDAFLAAVKAIHGPGNHARGGITFYLSDDIYFNLARLAKPDTDSNETMLTALARMPGVAGFKSTDEFQGNEFAGVILSTEFIRPIVGMPVTTQPIPRVTAMDDFNLLVWSASGLQIKADASGRSGVLYASS